MLDIKKESIIITENIYKERILNEMNNSKELLQFHFMTMNEFIKKYTFDYSYKAILYLMKKYHFKCEVAIKYLDNIYYIEDREYKSKKLKFLKNLKNELDKEGLLIYNSLFKEYIKKVDIIVYKYDLNKFESNILNKLDNVKIISKEYLVYPHDVYKFSTTNDEVDFVSYSIAKLLEDGIDINKIKIANIEGYENSIEKVFKMYNIPINIDFKYSIYSTQIAKDFLNNLNDSFEKAIESIDKYKCTDIYEQIINICNKYTYEPLIKDIIVYDLKHTYKKIVKYKNAIEVIDYKFNEITDEYVFLLGFNLGSIPISYKDEEFITDNIKSELNLDMTIEKNIMERETTINSINNIKNLIITYKESDNGSKVYPSDLIKKYNVKEIINDVTKSYSILNDKLKLASYLDLYFKYGEKNNNLDILNNSYSIPYRSYNNSYVKIDSNKLKEYLGNTLTLSYSSMDKYNRCAFRYYLSNILKLDIYKESFYTFIGNLFHHILELGIKEDINCSYEIEKYLGDRKFTNKEKFYLNKLVKDLPFIINTIKEQLKLSKLNKSLEETEIVINKEGDTQIIFKGYIDKIIYNDDSDITILALIDYKTGYSNIDLSYISYGINMQLPVYLYLTSHLDFQNIKIAGFYLQKVLLPEVKRDKYKSSIEQKKEYLKLEGYTISNESIISNLDLTYKDSSIIKGLKVNKDGSFSAYAKIIHENKLKKLVKITEDKINEVEKNILDSNFNINPKKDDIKNIGCENCNFRNICYKSKKDEVYIKAIKLNDLLGGEENE